MRAALPLLFLAASLGAATSETIAGTGVSGAGGDGDAAVKAQVGNPYGLTLGPNNFPHWAFPVIAANFRRWCTHIEFPARHNDHFRTFRAILEPLMCCPRRTDRSKDCLEGADYPKADMKIPPRFGSPPPERRTQ